MDSITSILVRSNTPSDLKKQECLYMAIKDQIFGFKAVQSKWIFFSEFLIHAESNIIIKKVKEALKFTKKKMN